MAIDWNRYLVQVSHEIRIIFIHSIVVAVFTLSLQFIQWDNDLLLSLMHLLVFFFIAHTEDRTTVDLPWQELMIRLATGIIIHFISREGSLSVKRNYLDSSLSEFDTDDQRPNLIILDIIVEYLDALRLLSAVRIYILSVILIIFAAPAINHFVQGGIEFVSNIR